MDGVSDARHRPRELDQCRAGAARGRPLVIPLDGVLQIVKFLVAEPQLSARLEEVSPLPRDALEAGERPILGRPPWPRGSRDSGASQLPLELDGELAVEGPDPLDDAVQPTHRPCLP